MTEEKEEIETDLNVSNLSFMSKEVGNKFQENATLLHFEESTASQFGSLPNHTFTNYDPTRLLIKYCIFVLFFISLMAIGLAILKKRFMRQKTQPWPGGPSRLRRPRRRWKSNVQNGNPSSQIPSISILSSSCPQPLTYYYEQPRRVLWNSFYPQNLLSQNANLVNPSSNVNSNSILCPSNLLPVIMDLITEEKCHVAKSSSSNLSVCPPPKYEDIVTPLTVLGLPSYEEAVLVHPKKSIHGLS